MKKKILICLTFILALFSLASCIGQTTEHSGGSGNINNSNTPGANDEDLIEYTVRLYRNGRLWPPNIDIEAVFDNGVSTTSVPIDSFTGEATFLGDGEYNVHLSALPSNYVYNPNENIVTPQHPTIDIVLYALERYTSGTGAYSPISSAYRIQSNGYFEVTLDSATDVKYFQMKPTNPGEYTVESIVDVYDDMINPTFKFYFGHETYRNENSPEISEDGGYALSGGFTKNFKYNIPWDVDQLHQWQNFSIQAESKTGDYPITVRFKITYAGEYHMPYPDRYPIYPTETINNTLDSDGTLTAISTATGGNLDALRYAYWSRNELGDGYWHIYDPVLYSSNGGYGPRLVFYITATIPCLGFPLEEILTREPFGLCVVDECYNYMLYGSGPLYYNDQPLQYTADYYAAHQNSDGVVYVTDELRTFLQKLAINRRYFFDGLGYLENLERNPVTAGEENQWLFACGYYA